MTERTLRICDACHNEITKGEKYINAAPYGAHFHEGCIVKMSAKDMIVALNLDDIKLMVDDNWQDAVKACYLWRTR